MGAGNTRSSPAHTSSSLLYVAQAPASNEVLLWLLSFLQGVAPDPASPSGRFSPICPPGSFAIPFCSFPPLTQPRVCNEPIDWPLALADSPRGPGSSFLLCTSLHISLSQIGKHILQANAPFLCPS